MKIRGFEWDEGNILRLEMKRGVTPREAEEVFAVAPLFRKTKRGHYAALGRTLAGRLLVVAFAVATDGNVRVLTAWDMKKKERRYYYERKRG